jgi:hypothetical protein
VRLVPGWAGRFLFFWTMNEGISDKTRVSLPVVTLMSVVLGVAGGVAGAITTGYALKEQIVVQIRDERRREFDVLRDAGGAVGGAGAGPGPPGHEAGRAAGGGTAG